MAEIMAQQSAALAAPASRQDVVSELLDDYTYDAEDVSPKSASSPAFKELPPPPRTDSFRDPKAEAIQRMNTKFQLREDDNSSVSSNGSRNGSVDQTPRARITSRSLSRSGTPPALQLFVSNGATAHIPPTPVVYPPVQTLPSNFPDSKELPPPPPPERSIKRKELQASAMGHKPSKSELERNDSFHSQNGDKPSETSPSETAATAPVVKRKAITGPGVKKFVSLLELNNGPRGGKPAPAPTSAPRKEVPSKISTSSQLPPTPPEEQSAPSPPRKALVGAGLPSNPRTKQPGSPLHIRGKSSTGFNVLKAQRPAPPVPTMRKEVTTPEPTPSPTLKPEVRMDNEISPMKPLPSPSEARRPFSYEGPTELGSPEQKTKQSPQPEVEQKVEQETKQEVEQEASVNVQDERTSTLAPEPAVPTPASQPSFPMRTTSLDPPEPSPSMRPSTAPAPQSTFTTKHPSLSTSTLPTNLDQYDPQFIEEEAFVPLTQQAIPLPITLIPRITPSQLSCYTAHATHVWSNNVFQPMGCQVCHSNEKDRKFSCTWCQLRICRACSEELAMVGRDLGKMLEGRARSREQVVRAGEREGAEEGAAPRSVDQIASEFRVLVEDVDLEAVLEEEEDERERRGRSMVKVESKERNGGITPRE